MLDANATHISLTLEGISVDFQMLAFVGHEALNLNYENLEPVPGASYRVDFADGPTREGVLDDDGFARLEDVPQGPAKVYYGEDPRQFTRESVTVVQNSDEKVNEDLRKLGLDPDQINLQALVEKA